MDVEACARKTKPACMAHTVTLSNIRLACLHAKHQAKTTSPGHVYNQFQTARRKNPLLACYSSDNSKYSLRIWVLNSCKSLIFEHTREIVRIK